MNSKFSVFISHFRMYLKLAKSRFLILPVFMLFSGIFDGLGIVLFFPLLDKLHVGPQQTDNTLLMFFYRFLDSMRVNNLMTVLVFIFLVFFLKFVVTFLQEFAIQKIMRSMYHRLSLDIINGWQEADYQKLYLNSTTGYFTNILTSSVWTLLGAFRYYCFTLVNIFYIFIYILLSFVLDAKITSVALICGILMFIFFKRFTDKTASYSLKFTEENVLFSSRLVEFMQFYKYLKSTFQFQKLGRNLENNIKKITGLQFRIGMISNFLVMIVEPIAVLLVVVLLYIQIVVWGKEFSAIAVLILLFYRTLTSIIGLQASWQKYFGSLGGINMVMDNLKKVENYKELPGAGKIESFSRQLSLENVNFCYGNKQVLSNININLEKNKTIALVGPSGVGKSTIVDLITGILRPSSGRIVIDGAGYNDLDLSSLRSMLGYVIQENVMFNDTIFNNITLWDDGSAGQRDERVKEACKKAYCGHFIEKLPLKYETIVGDRGVKLSVGQRQRIAIARELYRNAQILIFDEATSSLDTESENFIKQSIENLKGNKTMVIIAHRLSTIKNADYIYVLEGGRIIEEGSFSGLFENRATKFYRMCKMQSF